MKPRVPRFSLTARSLNFLSARAGLPVRAGRVFALAIVLTSEVLLGCQPKPPPPPPAQPEAPANAITYPEARVAPFTVESVPNGSSVSFSTGQKCKTPCAMRLNSGNSFDLHIEHEGYKSADVSVVSVVRAIPGSGKKGTPKFEAPQLSPNPVHVTLEPSWSKH